MFDSPSAYLLVGRRIASPFSVLGFRFFLGIILFLLRLIRSVFSVIDECVAARKGLIPSYLEELHNLSIVFLQIGEATASVSQMPESVLLQLFYYL